jgi:hypothetical protein
MRLLLAAAAAAGGGDTSALAALMMSPEGAASSTSGAPVWPAGGSGSPSKALGGSPVQSPRGSPRASDMNKLNKMPSMRDGYDDNSDVYVQPLSFDEFINGSGRVLHESYLDIKEALKTNKQRQKEIVGILNKRKAIIDELSEAIKPGDEQGTVLTELQEQLSAAKKEYRAAKTELTLCKSQISEADSLKKRAMAALMRAFEQAKKMKFGEFTIYLQAGNIVRYKIEKSESIVGKKSNDEALKDAGEDMGGFETIAI